MVNGEDILKLLLAGIGTSSSGEIDRGNGKMVSWSFEGHFSRFQWKYKGRCVDKFTGEVGKSEKQSRDGAIDHAFRDLVRKLEAKNAL